eukprot:1378943-Amorphochlora_amoeboformis.AAC.1
MASMCYNSSTLDKVVRLLYAKRAVRSDVNRASLTNKHPPIRSGEDSYLHDYSLATEQLSRITSAAASSGYKRWDLRMTGPLRV